MLRDYIIQFEYRPNTFDTCSAFGMGIAIQVTSSLHPPHDSLYSLTNHAPLAVAHFMLHILITITSITLNNITLN